MGSTSHPSQVTSTCSTRRPRIEDEDVAPDDVVTSASLSRATSSSATARRSHSSSTADTTSRTRIDDSVGGGRGAGELVSAATSSSPPRRCGGVYFDLSIARRAAPHECATSEGDGGDTQGEVAPEPVLVICDLARELMMRGPPREGLPFGPPARVGRSLEGLVGRNSPTRAIVAG